MAMQWDQYDYLVSDHFLPLMINGDASGMTDEEEKQFTQWEQAQHRDARAHGWTVGHWDADSDDADDFGECDVTGKLSMRVAARLMVYKEVADAPPAPAVAEDTRPRAYRIEWIHGYDEHAPEVHPLSWFHCEHGFTDEDWEAIRALSIGERVRLGGPCDTVRITCLNANLTDWDASTLEGEALAREIPALHIALRARHDSAEARAYARQCLQDMRALSACIAHAQQQEAAEEETERQDAYFKQSGR